MRRGESLLLPTLFVLLVGALLLLPFLGMALFHSKGEPREAIVAVSMLQSGDWVLPVSNGDVIPYKPPLLAWCIALFSLVFNGGVVTEYLSRLPSALALIVLTTWTFRFFARRTGDKRRAVMAAVVMLTSFEVYRAGMACRVDMLLTLFMVGSFYALYGYWERGMKGFPLLAVLMMSGAMLTKGPIGILLPCAVVGLFMLVRGVNFWSAAWRLALLGVCALVLPSIWYMAAYTQGGEEFYRLAMEENIGRLTGTMSYDSHVNPWPYNLLTVVLGMLPYTLLVVMGLFGERWRELWQSARGGVRQLWDRFRAMSAAEVFTAVCVVAVFVFYCIPKSKRSVYLLPIYPFLAWWMAGYALHLVKRGSRAVKIYLWTICVVALLAYVAYVVVQAGWFPYGVLKGRHALENAMMVTSLYNHDSWVAWLGVSVSAVAAAVSLTLWRRRASEAWPATLISLYCLYVAFGCTYQPGVLNAKSDKAIAREVERVQPQGPIYAHVATDMLRFFSVDFYTGDRVKPFELTNPEEGVMLVGVQDARTWLPANADKYDFYLLKHFPTRSPDIRQDVLLLRFRTKQQ